MDKINDFFRHAAGKQTCGEFVSSENIIDIPTSENLSVVPARLNDRLSALRDKLNGTVFTMPGTATGRKPAIIRLLEEWEAKCAAPTGLPPASSVSVVIGADQVPTFVFPHGGDGGLQGQKRPPPFAEDDGHGDAKRARVSTPDDDVSALKEVPDAAMQTAEMPPQDNAATFQGPITTAPVVEQSGALFVKEEEDENEWDRRSESPIYPPMSYVYLPDTDDWEEEKASPLPVLCPDGFQPGDSLASTRTEQGKPHRNAEKKGRQTDGTVSSILKMEFGRIVAVLIWLVVCLVKGLFFALAFNALMWFLYVTLGYGTAWLMDAYDPRNRSRRLCTVSARRYRIGIRRACASIYEVSRRAQPEAAEDEDPSTSLQYYRE